MLAYDPRMQRVVTVVWIALMSGLIFASCGHGRHFGERCEVDGDCAEHLFCVTTYIGAVPSSRPTRCSELGTPTKFCTTTCTKDGDCAGLSPTGVCVGCDAQLSCHQSGAL